MNNEDVLTPFTGADETADQLRGRAAFLRDKGEVKSPQLMEMAADFIDQRIKLRTAVIVVLEGWTLPYDARKILETALWSDK